MPQPNATLDDARRFYAAILVAASGSSDPRLGGILETVPREAFLPTGPWNIVVINFGAVAGGACLVPTPTADPIHLYQNVLVSLDPDHGINNGEPKLHAAWLGAAAPQAGNAITHIGTGTGYYTAILAKLAGQGGRVTAFELQPHLAAAATRNLSAYETVTVTCANAVDASIPPSDLIYVNAGVVAPPRSWLAALKPGGRLMFPWRPTERIGLAMLITRTSSGYGAKPLMPAWFIPCIGADVATSTSVAPDYAGAWRTRSVRFASDQAPDTSATAVYDDIWFSDQPVAVDAGAASASTD